MIILFSWIFATGFFFYAKQNGLFIVERAGKCQETSAVNGILALQLLFIQLR